MRLALLVAVALILAGCGSEVRESGTYRIDSYEYCVIEAGTRPDLKVAAEKELTAIGLLPRDDLDRDDMKQRAVAARITVDYGPLKCRATVELVDCLTNDWVATSIDSAKAYVNAGPRAVASAFGQRKHYRQHFSQREYEARVRLRPVVYP